MFQNLIKWCSKYSGWKCHNFGSSFWESHKNDHFDACVMNGSKMYYKEDGDASFQIWTMVNPMWFTMMQSMIVVVDYSKHTWVFMYP